MKMTRNQIVTIIALHLILAVYSVSGVLSKMASKTHFLDLDFCLYYCGLIILLGIYAIVWQQIIKKLPLTVAFANKAITVVWGIVWGMVLFEETISIGQLVGASLIMIGIVLYSRDIEEEDECPN